MTLPSVLDILYPPGTYPPGASRPYPCGWNRCPCDVVFWDDGADVPNLRPFHFWTCWRKIRRATARRGGRPKDEGWLP